MSKLIRRTLVAISVAVALVTVGALAPPFSRDDAQVASAGQKSFGQPQDIEAVAARAELLQDPALFAEVGSAYVSRASTTADPSLLAKAEAALETSLELAPTQNPDAAIGMAQLANSRHDFKASVRWAKLAIAENPYAAAPLGLLGDALFELGHVKAADAAYQRMVDLRPDVASYIRASYALGFAGDSRRALVALKMAERSVTPASEQAAFVLHQQGDVLYGLKRFARAEAVNRTGMEIAPGYAPPMVGTAESLMGQGRYTEAVPLLEEATRLLPSFSYLTTLADLYLATGDEEKAEATYLAADAALRDLRDNGVLPDNDLILYESGRGGDIGDLLTEARTVYRDRPTAKAADALAWILYLDGQVDEAHRLASRAVRLAPTESAHCFHLAVISEELGRTGAAARHAARALASDPAFSLPDLAEARRIAKLSR
jgi:tetratricopeptide (TPR) repeat protein